MPLDVTQAVDHARFMAPMKAWSPHPPLCGVIRGGSSATRRETQL